MQNDGQRPRERGARALGVSLVLIGGLVVGGCSSDSGDGGGATETTPTTSSASSASSVSSGGDVAAATPAFVDIVTCDNLGGSGTATGTIENIGDVAASYRLTIGFLDLASGDQLASGSQQVEAIAPGASADWTITVDGLGAAEVECKTVDFTSGAGPATTITVATGTAEGGGGEFPCSLLSQAEIDELAGNTLDPGDATTGDIIEDTVSYVAHTCSWTALGVTDPVEVIVQVSRAEDFPSGSTLCPPLPGADSTVPGVGDEASWAFSGAGTSIEVGELRVCSSSAVISVMVSGPGSEQELQQVALDVEAAIADAL